MTKVTVVEKNESLDFYPSHIERELDNGILLEVMPLSANELNVRFGDLSKMTGKYKSRNVSSSRKDFSIEEDKQKVNPMLQMITGIEEYCSEHEMKKSTVNKLITRVVFLYGDINDKKILEKLTLRNPYFINNNYLSVYKLRFVNPTNTPKFIKRSDIDIVSGKEMLPLISKENLNLSKLDSDNHLLFLRLNLEEETKIYPQDTIVKYVSTPPLNFNNKKLKLYVGSQKYDFGVEYKKTVEKRDYEYQRVSVISKLYYNKILAITMDDNEFILPVEGNDLLISKTLKSKILIFSFQRVYGKLYLSSKEMSVEDMLTNNRVSFDDYDSIDFNSKK